MKRAHTTPDQEQVAALQLAGQFFSGKTKDKDTPAHTKDKDPPTHTKDKDAPAHAVLKTERKPAPAPAVPVVDEALVHRKITSIIEELVSNSDLKVSVVGQVMVM